MNSLSAWVEVDLDALASNLRLIRRLVGPRVRVHLVVKADAYGHGASRIAKVAEEEG
ncbi:MAG: alanine racemase, partial [bacterium]